MTSDSFSRPGAQAQRLGEFVAFQSELELAAEVSLNIVCFRYVRSDLRADELDVLNRTIVMKLQEQGIAAPSTTRLAGKTVIRTAITNHHTTSDDLELLATETLRSGKALSNQRFRGGVIANQGS